MRSSCAQFIAKLQLIVSNHENIILRLIMQSRFHQRKEASFYQRKVLKHPGDLSGKLETGGIHRSR
jgi:hypothetical protein